MSWLVTGGAGYIGGHVVRALLAAGRSVVVLDDLSTGRRSTVPVGVPFVEGSVTDARAVRAALRGGVTGIVHLAGQKSVAASVQNPQAYYRGNAEGTRTVVDAMVRAKVACIVFSSSAAVYGQARGAAVSERTVPRPVNPYGRSKLASEWVIADAARAFGLHQLCLRYFNVAGTAEPELRDRASTGLLPSALDAVAAGRRPVVFGIDYPTDDGSCVRDYVHVVDVAAAHVRAVEVLESQVGGASGVGSASGFGRASGFGGAYNVGRGVGCSVLQMLAVIGEVTGREIRPEIGPRRAGDCAQMVARVDKINREFGWHADFGIADMVASEWQARTATS